MKRKLLVISALIVVILLLGLGTTALADELVDIDFSFVEDSGDFVRISSLLPDNAEDAEYHCDMYFRYGWLEVKENGDFRYELDADNADVVKAFRSGRTLTENVTLRYRDELGTEQLLAVSFVIQPMEADVPANSYALVNDGTAVVAEGNFFRHDDTQSDEQELVMIGVQFAGGEYMLNDDLELTYNLSNRSRAVQQLSSGQRSVKHMKFRLRADDGSTIMRVVGITVRGVNDVPSVRSAAHALSLGGKCDVSGSALAGSKLGDGAASRHRFAWTTAASAARYGTVTLEDDGDYTYELDEDNATVRSLTENSAPLTETFAFTYKDKDGDRVEGSVTFTVAYSELSPRVVNQTATLTEDAGADNDDPCYVFSGSALTGSVPGNGTAAQHTFAWTDTATSAYGTVELNADGSFSFRMNNAWDSVQNLYPGVGVQQTYGYTYTDVEGDQVTGSVIVTLKGANDRPQLQSFTHSFTEDVGVSANNPIYTIDGNALMGATRGDGALTTSRFAWNADNAAKYGNMTRNADGSYTYQLNNDSRAVQALKAGETVNDVFAYTYTDANGDRASGSVTVTVTGAKDAPTVENKSHSLSLGGTVRVSGNALTKSTLGDGSEEDHTFAWTAEAITAAENAQYGTVTLEDDGDYTYELDEDNEIVRNMPDSPDSLTEVFSFTYSNEQDTANASVTVTINYNDIHPTVATVVLEVTEDGTDADGENCLPLTGNVLTDCTLGNGIFANHSFTWTTGENEAQYGEVTLNTDGTYSYTLDTSACQSLKPGDTWTESFRFNYMDTDGDIASGSLIINITGANDAPVWNGAGFSDLSSTVMVDKTMSNDVGAETFYPNVESEASDDDGDTLFFTCKQQGSKTYGEMRITDSRLAFYLDNDNAAVQALTGDERLSVTYDIYISDGIASVLIGRIVIIIS